MPITISLDPARQDLDAIHRMLAGTYWSPGIRRDVVAEALRNSITAVAIDDATGATIGLARVVTDRATFAWLCDVFVDERFRGQGGGGKGRVDRGALADARLDAPLPWDHVDTGISRAWLKTDLQRALRDLGMAQPRSYWPQRQSLFKAPFKTAWMHYSAAVTICLPIQLAPTSTWIRSSAICSALNKPQPPGPLACRFWHRAK
jgi:GNAT superfamily N-acetyltransferase